MTPELTMRLAQCRAKLLEDILLIDSVLTQALEENIAKRQETPLAEPITVAPPTPTPTRRAWVFKPGELQRCLLEAYESADTLTFAQAFAYVKMTYPLADRGSVQSRHAQLVTAGEICHVPGQPRLYQRAAQRPQLSILP